MTRRLTPLIGNALSVLSTTAVTSGAGLVFWWLAARLLTPAEVGQGTAAVSVITLLSTLGMLGLGTLLIGLLPDSTPREARQLVGGALVICAGAGAILGALGALTLGTLVPDLSWMATPLGGVWMVGGVAVGAATLTFDQAVIGQLRGHLQLWRNALMSVSRIPLLWGLAALGGTPSPVLQAWIGATLLSLGVWLPVRGPSPVGWPSLRALRPHLGAAARHHALNLSMQAPMLVIPVLAASLLAPERNAQFYLAWMVAGFLGMVPTALALVLPALKNSSQGARGQLRQSLRWSLWGCLIGAGALMAAAPWVLGLFGPAYQGGSTTLQLLALLAFPGIVKAHYIALGRMAERPRERRGSAGRDLRLGQVAVAVAVWGGAEILAALAGLLGGLELWRDGALGLSAALLLISALEAAWMVPAVWRAADG